LLFDLNGVNALPPSRSAAAKFACEGRLVGRDVVDGEAVGFRLLDERNEVGRAIGLPVGHDGRGDHVGADAYGHVKLRPVLDVHVASVFVAEPSGVRRNGERRGIHRKYAFRGDERPRRQIDEPESTGVSSGFPMCLKIVL